MRTSISKTPQQSSPPTPPGLNNARCIAPARPSQPLAAHPASLSAPLAHTSKMRVRTKSNPGEQIDCTYSSSQENNITVQESLFLCMYAVACDDVSAVRNQKPGKKPRLAAWCDAALGTSLAYRFFSDEGVARRLPPCRTGSPRELMFVL
ncbi:hypothetical protein BU23DRAFT_553509 [Bimuria novae-zelandiae CBS 107.79]|uniref:Uncharacterized protein n=1 Tax=Bimuria novae-zelandiae CBS 107.79 TaxID=1447943 RepID=A0A6A5VGD1_9PLEO|nr:hypothetical protein BU23DRAFT_553509 [Bimuria novae-zelandiae CBS 107.79]